MAKTKLWLNMITNALSFVAFLSLMSSGMILHFTLPPRSGPRTFLNLTRHEWGQMHFVTAVVFLSLLVIHLVLHWSWLYATAWGSKVNPQPVWKRAITTAILAYIAMATALPFLK